jgi:hypothetical protein
MRPAYRLIFGRILGTFLVLALAFVCRAGASATLLLEEPYGKLGFFTATGHAAVYLSGVCAETPVQLRPCRAGETGVVLSRYNGVGGYDWIAIPLIPYLYAVDRPDDVPLFADARMVAFLRDSYRRKYLETVAPDGKNGETPGGNWYELVGSSYDRTIYGFEIETTPEQDESLIRKYNAAANRSHFNTVSNNCADFAKDVINFYHPKALRRSLVADIGITTPKQLAKRLVKFSEGHADVQLSRVVIPQVPGSMPRSAVVHGVVESFFKSKKYIVPSAVVSPIFAGCVAAVYIGSENGRFDPARDAMVFNPVGEPEKPMGREDWRAYRLQLKHVLEANAVASPGTHPERTWRQLQSRADTEIDVLGRPAMLIRVGEKTVSLGATATNLLSGDAPANLARELLLARLQAELHQKMSHPLSQKEVERDWDLLQQITNEQTVRIDPAALSDKQAARMVPVASLRSDSGGGNKP